jgi:hypothetical protein
MAQHEVLAMRLENMAKKLRASAFDSLSFQPAMETAADLMDKAAVALRAADTTAARLVEVELELSDVESRLANAQTALRHTRAYD